MGWQHDWAERLEARAAALAGVRGLRVFGSVVGSVGGGQLDRWSDLDVEVLLDAAITLDDLVPWLDVWAYEEHADGDQVLRMFDHDGHHLDLVVRGAHLTGLPDLDPTVNEVRFGLALAAVKLGRGDRLIGTHLFLGVARTVLVEAMLLRDADTGRTVHRTGTARDAVVDRVLAATDPLSLAAVFDDLHRERHPDYQPDWRGLVALAAP